jgi:hypothetical protein
LAIWVLKVGWLHDSALRRAGTGLRVQYHTAYSRSRGFIGDIGATYRPNRLNRFCEFPVSATSSRERRVSSN